MLYIYICNELIQEWVLLLYSNTGVGAINIQPVESKANILLKYLWSNNTIQTKSLISFCCSSIFAMTII